MKTTLLPFACALAVLGCKTAPPPVADVPIPTVPAQELVIVTQSLTDVAVKFTGSVEAGAQAVTLNKAAYEFVVDGDVLKTGEVALNVQIAPGATQPFSIEQGFTYVKDGEALKAMDARGGALLIALRGTVSATVTIPAQGEAPAVTKTVALPFAHAKEVRTPRLPHVKLVDFEAGRFSESEVQVLFHVGVVNPNPFPITVASLPYTVELAGKKVGEGSIGAGDHVTNASTGVFDVSVTMNEETHGKDVKKIIKGLNVAYAVTGTLKTAMYDEALEAKGEIKLTPPK